MLSWYTFIFLSCFEEKEKGRSEHELSPCKEKCMPLPPRVLRPSYLSASFINQKKSPTHTNNKFPPPFQSSSSSSLVSPYYTAAASTPTAPTLHSHNTLSLKLFSSAPTPPVPTLKPLFYSSPESRCIMFQLDWWWWWWSFYARRHEVYRGLSSYTYNFPPKCNPFHLIAHPESSNLPVRRVCSMSILLYVHCEE